MTRIIGIVLICIGLIGLAFGGISYTTQEEVADVGPVEVEKEEEQSIPLTPIASGAALVIGVGLVYVGRKEET